MQLLNDNEDDTLILIFHHEISLFSTLVMSNMIYKDKSEWMSRIDDCRTNYDNVELVNM
jgi:hypothetical protein